MVRIGGRRRGQRSCARTTFVEDGSLPFAREIQRVIEPVRLFGHAAGGRIS